MPMIDVYAAADLSPAGTDRQLGKELTMAVLRAGGVTTPGPFHLTNTAAYIHRMDPHAVHMAATDPARTQCSGQNFLDNQFVEVLQRVEQLIKTNAPRSYVE
jgi:hypothetical protein